MKKSKKTRKIKFTDDYLNFLTSKEYTSNDNSWLEYILEGFKNEDPHLTSLFLEEVYQILTVFKYKNGLNLNESGMIDEWEDLKTDFIIHLTEIKHRVNFSYNNKNSFEGYLYRCFNNWLLDRIRNSNCKKNIFKNSKNKVGLENFNDKGETIFSNIDLLTLKKTVSTFLGEEVGKIFELLFIECLSVKKCSMVLGITPQNVYYNQRKISDFLRSKIIKDRITLLNKN